VTFSDSGVVELLKKEFVICWQSVCDVRRVEFDLGNGRKSLGILNGELAVHVCDTEGKSFKIIPGLRSPVEMADKLTKSVEIFKNRASFKTAEEWESHIITLHKAKHAAPITLSKPIPFNYSFPNQINQPTRDLTAISSKGMLLTEAIDLTALSNPTEKAKNNQKHDFGSFLAKSVVTTRFVEVEQFENLLQLPENNIAAFNNLRTQKVPNPTVELREMVGKSSTRSSLRNIPTSTSVIVNPGNTPDYDKGVSFAFQGTLPINYASSAPWSSKLKTPAEWTKVLFEGIMKQKMQGGSVKYESVRGTPFTLISK